jgi:protein TonB
MSYLQRQRNPLQSLSGLAAVVTLHIIVIYALIVGLKTPRAAFVPPPMTTQVIDTLAPPPSPPPPAPGLVTPQPLTLPAPEIVLARPPETHAQVTAPRTAAHEALPPVPHPSVPTANPEYVLTTAHVIAGSPGPAYPDTYQDTGKIGRVTVDCVIETTGAPTQCRVLAAVGGSAFATETLRWLTGPSHPVYRPAMHDGLPRREEHQWVVRFEAPE